MNILHLTKADYRTQGWSGGTTTEAYIYPRGADYAARQFLFRISSAKVDLPESDFTPLEGVTRYITPISGGFTLTHPGMPPVEMSPLAAPYCFSGEIPTHCVGQATDFNLMLKGVDGSMNICHGSAPVHPGFNCFYAVEDSLFFMGENRYDMKAGELLAVFSRENAEILLGDVPVIGCWVSIDPEEE